MQKETSKPQTAPPPKAPKNGNAPAQALPMEEVRKLTRKVSMDHEELFRRLAK